MGTFRIPNFRSESWNRSIGSGRLGQSNCRTRSSSAWYSASVIPWSLTLAARGCGVAVGGAGVAVDSSVALGSPFDFENSTLLYLVNDIPEPMEANAYQREVESAIIRLAKATGGRMLALFTSYAQLKRTAKAIGPAMEDAGIQARVSSRLARARSGRHDYTEAEQNLLDIFRDAGCFIDISGFAVSTQWGRSYYDPLFAYLTNILIARRNSTPFFILPQSMGPLDYPMPARILLFPLMKLAFSYPRPSCRQSGPAPRSKWPA